MLNPSRKHLAELDVVRFWAFFAVFVFHAFRVYPAVISLPMGHVLFGASLITKETGRFGVDLFFTLSAFLITSLLVSEKEDTGKLHLWRFYVRRMLRIWPLYFAVAFTMFGLAAWLHEPELHSYFWPFVLLAPNWAWVMLGTPHVQHAMFLSLMVFWSLGMEEQFYLIWPLLMRKSTLLGLRKAAWGMLALSAIVRMICWANDVPHPGIYANTLAHLDPIGVGVLIAAEWAAFDRTQPGASLRLRSLAHPIALLAGIALFFLGGWMSVSGGINGPLFVFFGYPAVAWGGYLVLFHTLLNLRPESAGLAFRKLAYLGKISYGLYVFHGFVMVLTQPLAQWITRSREGYWEMGFGQMGVNFLLALAGTILLAHLSFTYYESHFLRMKSKFSGIKLSPVQETSNSLPANGS